MRMVGAALSDAGVSPGDIDYVNAHGTGTELNDATECEVIEAVFGRDVLVNSTKSLLGHTIGASGAIEAAATALSVASGAVHGCRNLADPIAPLNFVRRSGRYDPKVAFSQSFAFGGHNAGLVIGQYSP